MIVTRGTMLSDHSAIDASSPASLSISKPPPIPSGFLVLAIGSAPVSPNHPFISLFHFSNKTSLSLSFLLSFPHLLCNGCFTCSCSWCYGAVRNGGMRGMEVWEMEVWEMEVLSEWSEGYDWIKKKLKKVTS